MDQADADYIAQLIVTLLGRGGIAVTGSAVIQLSANPTTTPTVGGLGALGAYGGNLYLHTTANGDTNWTKIGATDLSGYVPTSRKVNGRELSADFDLPIADESARVFNVGSGRGMYSTLDAAMAAVNALSPAPTWNTKVLVQLWPGEYQPAATLDVPGYVYIRGVQRGLCRIKMPASGSIFRSMGTTIRFENFMVTGSTTNTSKAFNLNNQSGQHFCFIDLLDDPTVAVHGMIEQAGADWAWLIMEHCKWASSLASGQMVSLVSTALRDCSVVMEDIRCETFSLTAEGGALYAENVDLLHVRDCQFRGGNSGGTSCTHFVGVKHLNTTGAGTARLRFRHSNAECRPSQNDGVGIYSGVNTDQLLVNSDALGATYAGTRTLRNSSV